MVKIRTRANDQQEPARSEDQPEFYPEGDYPALSREQLQALTACADKSNRELEAMLAESDRAQRKVGHFKRQPGEFARARSLSATETIQTVGPELRATIKAGSTLRNARRKAGRIRAAQRRADIPIQRALELREQYRAAGRPDHEIASLVAPRVKRSASRVRTYFKKHDAKGVR
jgi:hypothetical protein